MTGEPTNPQPNEPLPVRKSEQDKPTEDMDTLIAKYGQGIVAIAEQIRTVSGAIAAYDTQMSRLNEEFFKARK